MIQVGISPAASRCENCTCSLRWQHWDYWRTALSAACDGLPAALPGGPCVFQSVEWRVMALSTHPQTVLTSLCGIWLCGPYLSVFLRRFLLLSFFCRRFSLRAQLSQYFARLARGANTTQPTAQRFTISPIISACSAVGRAPKDRPQAHSNKAVRAGGFSLQTVQSH